MRRIQLVQHAEYSQCSTATSMASQLSIEQGDCSSTPRQKCIVVIDDSATVRKIVETSLKREGFCVRCFADGVEALSWLGQLHVWRPDLVILDIELPHMDGYEVARHLKAHPQLQESRIIFLSRHDGLIDRLKGRLVGMQWFLPKPFTTQNLLQAVHATVSSC